jgi:uncharacterized protein (DUF983 family)
MLAGQVTVGAWWSATVTVNMQLPVWFEVSVTVHVTVVMPFGNTEPDAGLHTTALGPNGQLSLPVGVV